MIKHIISAALLMACALPLSAQDLQDEQAPKPKGTNYLTFDLGGGLHNIVFKTDNGDKNLKTIREISALWQNTRIINKQCLTCQRTDLPIFLVLAAHPILSLFR